MAAPIAAGMLMQTLYYLVDLYFVGRLGDAALAGVGAAGNVMMVVVALTQVLGVGTVALIAQAVGRKDAADANLVFNQSLLMAAGCAAFTIFGGYAVAGAYMRAVGADAARDAPAGHASVFERDNVLVPECHQPTDRAAESYVRRVPSHGLVELERVAQLRVCARPCGSVQRRAVPLPDEHE